MPAATNEWNLLKDQFDALVHDEIVHEDSNEKFLEPIREVPIHDEKFAARRLSMMRIMARRTNAATVVA
jgi:hypothetical protein